MDPTVIIGHIIVFDHLLLIQNAIFELGNYGNHGFIEMDYAHKWVEKRLIKLGFLMN